MNNLAPPRPEFDPQTLAVALLFANIAPPDPAASKTIFIGRETSVSALDSAQSTELSRADVVVIEYAVSPGAILPAVLQRMGLDLAEKAHAAQALFFKANPLAAQFLDGMRGRNMEAPLHVSSFREVCGVIGAAGLRYAAPAKLTDAILKLNFAREAAELLQAEPDLVLRETKKDLMLNRGLRCDIFMRAPQNLERQEAATRIARTRFRTVIAPEKITNLTLLTAYAEIKPTDSARRLFEILSKGAASPAEIAERRVPGCENVWANVDAAVVLMAMDAIVPTA
ncbi:MAG: methyltransferase regulatory domain-containing protein [Rhodospirillaceae bacterium]|nr:methyltransferase regulatory domain-containing protein [Rhodospirillaceae bacterium]